MFDFDIVKETEEILRKFEKLKENKEMGFCCVNSKTILWTTTLLQMIKANGLDAQIKIILKEKEK